jgi:phage-related protein (TIGR01555 family)
MHIPDGVLGRSRQDPKQGARAAKPFELPKPAPGVLPEGEAELAMDGAPGVGGWAAGYYGQYGWAFTEGLEFLGYPYLAELAQRPEYRRPVEIIATEMTRKWIRLHATGDDDKSDKIQKIVDMMDDLEVQRAFKTIAEQDGFFGRAHLYLDTGATDDMAELLKPIGDGRDKLSRNKVGKSHPLKAVKAIEAVWTYPTNYNSNDPLKGDWYKPDVWFVMGKRIHASRLLPFIGREVPDLLKPAYSFGGLALTQMGKPYVDNWLQTRQSVNDAISAYSVWALSTNMAETLQVGGEQLFRRAELFTNMRNNRGVMLLDKEMEELANHAATLSTLDLLQAQAQEHQAAVFGIPLVKLLGITPSGLNASSDGEIRSFYDWIAAYQEALFRTNLTKVIDFVQLSLFGDVDDEITFDFEPLWALNEKEQAEVDKLEAEAAQIRIDSGVISQQEERARIAAKPDTPYDGLDPEDMPDLLREELAGLEPEGGRPELQAAELQEKQGQQPKAA